jgi:hypothetical protein
MGQDLVVLLLVRQVDPVVEEVVVVQEVQAQLVKATTAVQQALQVVIIPVAVAVVPAQ